MGLFKQPKLTQRPIGKDGLPEIKYAMRSPSFKASTALHLIELNTRMARLEALQQQQVALLERLVAAAERD